MSGTIPGLTRRTLQVRREVFAFYLCSSCRNPIVAHIQISSSSSAKKTAASDSAERMNGVWERVLGYLQNPTPETYPWNILGYEFSGHNEPCPVCGTQEPWQNYTLLKSKAPMQPIKLFPSLRTAYTQAMAILLRRKEEARKNLSDPARYQMQRSRLDHCARTLQGLQNEKENGAAASQVAQLKAKQSRLEAQMKGLGLFSKERKALQGELTACAAALEKADDAYEAECSRLNAAFEEETARQKDELLLMRNYADSGVMLRSGNVIALVLPDRDREVPPESAVSMRYLPELTSLKCSRFARNVARLSAEIAAADGSPGQKVGAFMQVNDDSVNREAE